MFKVEVLGVSNLLTVCYGENGLYIYTQDLLSLDRRCRVDCIDMRLSKMFTPLVLTVWQKKLSQHKDREFVNYVFERLMRWLKEPSHWELVLLLPRLTLNRLIASFQFVCMTGNG